MARHASARTGLAAAAVLALTCGALTCGRSGEQGDRADAQAGGASRSPRASRARLVGKEAMGAWTDDAPGVRRLIRPGDLPEPYATRSVDNGPRVQPRPEGAMPRAPEGFAVDRFASGLDNPRQIATAPNGDLFVAESRAGRVRVLRDADGDGTPETVEVFASGLELPFGIAFYPPGRDPRFVYVAETGAVVRFPYRSGDLRARSGPATIVPDIPSGGRLRGGGHWTRDIAFSRDGKTMFVSVGSLTNAHENPNANEERRADILRYSPDGSNEAIYASGIRNAVGIAVDPSTDQLWASVNERDGLGDDLVPDYVTRVKEGAFYGWPWYYIGAHQDPRHEGAHPELRERVSVPDVLIQAHSASLGMTFYTADAFPAEYRGDAFAAQHGSWNRSRRTGYKVVRVPTKEGAPTGEYVDFLTGFVTPDGLVWGRPVGVAVGRRGELFVSDDGAGAIWRVVYTGSR